MLNLDEAFAIVTALREKGFTVAVKMLNDDPPYKWRFSLEKGTWNFEARLVSLDQLPNYAEIFLDDKKWL